MTSPGPEILRRPGLAEADRVGLLPAVASAGAQVRSVLSASAELPLMERPRAMVVVGGQAGGDAAFLTALVGRTAPSPILWAPTLPPWVGALDLVVVLAAHPEDELAAEAAGVARRRGATTVVRGAEHGPVADAAGAALLAPVVAVPEWLAACARWALLAVVAGRAGLGPAVELSRTADLLDATALACHPGAETFLNPGINLAEYLSEGTGLLVGCDPLGDALAAHGARVLADIGGVAAGVLPAASAGSSPALLRRIGGPVDLFADPFTDAEPGQLVKPLLVSTSGGNRPGPAGFAPDAPDRRFLSELMRAFTGAMHLDGSADALPVVAGPSGRLAPDAGPSGRLAPDAGPSGRLAPDAGPDDRGGRPGVAGADSFDAAVAAGVRLDFAAVYLGIVTGQLAPPDFPDGLGRSAGTRWAVRPATVGGVGREQSVDTWN